MLAPIVGVGVLLAWIIAEVHKRLHQRTLDAQTGISSIQTLDWREFERLLGEAFRRMGYAVEHVGGSAPDGGVDLRLTQKGQTTLVQ